VNITSLTLLVVLPQHIMAFHILAVDILAVDIMVKRPKPFSWEDCVPHNEL
jgi:hypothetical protein